MKKIIFSPHAPAPIGPYSQAVLVNGLLFVSGQIPINPINGNIVKDTIEEETHQVMKNIGAILTAAGADYQHIIKTTIFIRNMEDFSKINAVYGSYFSADPPARETVEVSRLPKDVNVEISCIAQI